MKQALNRLLDALDAIGETHGEICDTVVRETLFDAIDAHFVRFRDEATMPTSFGMFAPEADAAIADALTAFVTDPEVVAFREASTPPERLDAFQDATVVSGADMMYDDYFGHADGLA